MKNVACIFVIIFIANSCKKNELEPKPNINKYAIFLPPPPNNLKKPTVVLNDIAKGTLYTDIINSITLEGIYGNKCIWTFLPDVASKKILTLQFYKPNYNVESTLLTYQYKENGLIEEINSIRKNTELRFIDKRKYKYIYESGSLTGIIDSIYFKNYDDTSYKLMTVGVNYFSYNDDGTIAKIYAVDISEGDSFNGFNETEFTYDENKNVTIANQISFGNKYTFTYNNLKNPLKGIYVFSAMCFQLPSYGVESSIGPSFLSNNCIQTVKLDYTNATTPSNTKLESFSYNTAQEKIIDAQKIVDDNNWNKYTFEY